MDPNAINQISNSSGPINAQYVGILLSAVLGISMIYIAFQQYKTNQYKVRVNLYDRRFKIYQEVIKFLARIMRGDVPTDDDLIQLLRDTKGSEFLLGRKVNELINSLYKRGVDFDADTKVLKSDGQLSPMEKQRLLDKQSAHFDWFKNQFGTARQVFGTYLDVSKWT